MTMVKATAAGAMVATLVMALVACSAADLFVHFEGNDKAFVFSQNPRAILPNGFAFGDGQVFDYAVTTSAGTDGLQVARAQGLFYRSNNGGLFQADKEEFTILFVNTDGQYSGTSLSFSGVWVTDSVHEFPIQGGTGALAGLKGTVFLTSAVSGSVYKLEVNELTAPRFQSFLANAAYSHLV